MSEPNSARSDEPADEESFSQRPEHDEQDDGQELQDDEQGLEDGGADAAAASASVSPRAADAASPAESGEALGSPAVRVEDEKPNEESKRRDEEDEEAQARFARQQHYQRGMQDSGDGDGDGGGDGEGNLQQAAQEQLEELEPEAEQGSQTHEQRQQYDQHDQQQQHDEHGQHQHGDDGAYPDAVGSDSYVPRGPERQDYDDGGADPDQREDDEDDPAAGDYDNADRGQFDPAQGAPAPAYVMPDVLKVVINREELEQEAEEEEERELAEQAQGGYAGPRASFERTPEQVVYVQVIKDNLHHPKPFLGGFRHKYYGTVYHHSATQTARKKKKAERVKFHRETQTIQIISRSAQTNREAGTQMERSDLLQDHSNDRVILSRPYFTADELEALRDAKAKEIQCFLRQCFAWRRVRRLREAKADQVEQEAAARAEKEAKEQADHAAQIQRRMHPRTKADFAVLYAELEAWRLHETARIKESAGLSAEEIAVALQELLHKEVKLLQTIDRLKITAARENKWARTAASLEAMASPKEWSSREGDLIEVDTPFTTRAKELVDLYNGLLLRSLPRAQRVDVLLHVKYTVKEFDCALSRDIVDLIKREEDLLRRQRSEQSLEGLRRRLQNLFLHFVNTPQFNPEAANFQKVAEPAPLTGTAAVAAAAVEPPPPALSSSLAKPAMLTKSNTVTVASNVAGRMFAAKAQ